MIRDATEKDIPRMVEMGRAFRSGSTYEKHLADNPEKMAELGRKLIAANSLLVDESDGEIHGMLGYVIHNHFMSGETFAGEIFWWVNEDNRGFGLKLLREAEKRAKAAGATQMQMIAPNERVASLYQRLGYGFVESTFQRAL